MTREQNFALFWPRQPTMRAENVQSKTSALWVVFKEDFGDLHISALTVGCLGQQSAKFCSRAMAITSQGAHQTDAWAP